MSLQNEWDIAWDRISQESPVQAGPIRKMARLGVRSNEEYDSSVENAAMPFEERLSELFD
jgi:hypothetical protein